MTSQNYNFNTNSVHYEVVEIKGEKRFYITGHISTEDKDLVDDVVTKGCQASMLKQIKSKSIKLDYDHEAFRENTTILPVGKIIDGKIDSKGLWVKAELNDASPKFKALWKSIKKGFVDAFSIAFKPIKTTMKAMDGVTVRLLEDLELLNVALTGVPVNQRAKIGDVMMKALRNMDEVKQMEKEEIKQMEADLKSSAEKVEAFEKEVAELKSEADKVEALEKDNTELKSKVETLEKAAETKSEEEKAEEDKKEEVAEKLNEEVAEMKSKIEALEKLPILKSQVNVGDDGTNGQAAKTEVKSIIKNL